MNRMGRAINLLTIAGLSASLSGCTPAAMILAADMEAQSRIDAARIRAQSNERVALGQRQSQYQRQLTRAEKLKRIAEESPWKVFIPGHDGIFYVTTSNDFRGDSDQNGIIDLSEYDGLKTTFRTDEQVTINLVAPEQIYGLTFHLVNPEGEILETINSRAAYNKSRVSIIGGLYNLSDEEISELERLNPEWAEANKDALNIIPPGRYTGAFYKNWGEDPQDFLAEIEFTVIGSPRLIGSRK